MAENMETTKMPGELKWALLALATATVGGVLVALASMALQQKLGSTVTGFRYLGLSWRTALSVAYIIGLANGYGWFRWLFVIAMALSILFLAFILLAWLGSQGQARMLMAFHLSTEVPLLLLRALALVLLFRPVANLWFEQRAAARGTRNEISAP